MILNIKIIADLYTEKKFSLKMNEAENSDHQNLDYLS